MEHSRKALEYLGKDKIIHVYGPTETTVYASYYFINHIEENVSTIPIGKPISNTTAYILDNYLKPVPIGVHGELFIGGYGVSRGYLNNPELTAEKFVSASYKSYRSYRTYSSEKIYKTGDLVRWLLDGNIEFLGRIDSQVKIRGFRIELEEIESHLLQNQAIQEVVVIDRENEKGEKYLYAYMVPKPGVNVVEASKLREYLSRFLPEYMIPSYFVTLEHIPLTPNNKVNRKALPEPEVKVGEKHLAPANEIEETLVTLWSDILSLPPEVISTDANFFELGGHSLKATIMAARINQIFNTNLPLVEIFTSPDIRGLAQYTKSASKTGYVSIEPAEKREYYRLSSAQKRLFILQQMELSSTVYNIPQTLTLDSEIDREILENTLKTLIKRHESLRTSFKIIKGEPIQGVHEEVDFEIEYYDLTTEAGGFIRPFDLSQAPLLRARLIKIEPRKHLFMADIHHIIGDGLSLERLIKEFMICYEGGESKLPPLRLQYKDYAQWQNSQVGTESLQRQEAYWLEEFAEPVTVLTIPTDFARPAIQSFEGSTLNFRINEKETQRLQALASVEGATLFMVLLAAFNVLIARLSGSENITIGTPIAGRRHAQLEPIIGMFVNTLALRNHPNQVKTFTHFLKEVKASTLEAFENQDYPFEELVEKIEVTRDAGRNPVFDIMFTFWSAQEQPTPSPEAGEIEQRIAKFDLILGVTQEGSHLSCGFDYCTKLFKPETIEKFARYFCKIVTAVVKNPGQKLLQIDLLSEEEKQQLLVDFNDTELPYPNDKTLPQLFARQAARTPDGIALIGTKAGNVFNVTYTYQQLNQETNQLAHYLLQQGAAQNELVGLLVDRTPEMIIGILGILKAGCGYVPLNPKGPESRLKYILEECSARLLLTLSHLMDKNHWFDNCIYIDEVTRYPDMAVTEAKTRILPDHLAYAIFTSGTTGKPKGVPIKHANLSPLLHWGYRHLGIGSSDRIIQNLSYYFDWSVWEIFITLTTGACLYMISDEVLLNPEESIDFIDKNKITVLHATPTQYRYYVSVGRKLETLKYLFIGAEKLTLELMRRSLTSVKETCRVFNMYGPTEATIIAAVLEIRRGEEENFVHLSSVPIGIPVGNTRLFVLDKHLQLCPLNVVGELYIGGEGVSPGYLNRPELTSVKFDQDLWDFRDYRDEEKNRTGKRIYSPTHPLTHSTMYRTGDLARWLSDGNVEFLGRLDLQVKIRGYRIELGEIESHLLKHSLVKEPVVLALEDEAKAEKYLCAYIIPIEKIIDSEQGAERLGRELKRYLSSVLPDYMVPSYFIPIEKIPLNPNGKIDMRALPKPGLIAGKQRLSPRDEIEEKLLEIWCDVLELDIEADKEVPFGIEDNFFELGGHSLRATAMVSRIKKELKITVPLVEVFTSPTIEQLARYIKEVQSGETTGESEITVVSDNLMLLGKDTADAPNLFFIHDGSGEVEGYMALCQHLHQPVNCWGIRAGQRESMAPQNLTVETLSQHYIQIIKGIQPRGPYALIGWSLGGTIAFEMARKLEETNETMGFFSIIDSLPPSRERAQKVTGASEAFSLESEKKWLKKHLPKGQLKEQLRRLKDMNTLWRTVGEHLESVDPGGDSIRALLPTNILQVIPHSTQLLVKQLIYYLNVIRTLERACALYIPKNNVKTKLHYFAAHQSEGIVDKKQWQDFCENKVKFYELQGDHFSILQNPNVSGIASLVEKIMKSGQGGHNAH
ncbi:MAG: amino acid adenylation domain-containing protein [Candidatus Aminicenantes bacterium]|nr:amino acid adenylation domain-containing protein [Candidatus Aminicenantes bacterium]NIM80425.1 amino acid adenylation domain-containing protein [Candidatus Aminicenantes bacterium]NIN18938.1 amino acid adenylation domain-containing protein [Candidatus Aminicenantes bacterium]NIN43694.1 amino acid adenylation domain-containing protein [Candidatus Aminicenantes bacterium]NIN85575.1 amino acid adenylation domain-containing protein [Candidatus Aminicenantes bacterium]